MYIYLMFVVVIAITFVGMLVVFLDDRQVVEKEKPVVVQYKSREALKADLKQRTHRIEAKNHKMIRKSIV